MLITDRRLRLYNLPEHDLLHFLNMRSGFPLYVDVPVPALDGEECPADAKVVRIDYDYNRMSLVLTVHHPNFCLVPEGGIIPSYNAFWCMQRYKLAVEPIPVERPVEQEEQFGNGECDE